MKRLLIEIYVWLEAILRNIPGAIGVFFRKINYKIWLGSCGDNFRIGIYSRIQQPGALYLGKNVSFNDFAWIAANNKNGQIYIGDNSIVGPRCTIHSGNHIYDNTELPISKQGYRFAQIHIGSDVWLGANVTVLQGVSIGNGSVVAANSVVTKDVEPFTIVAGIPAKKIKDRK